MSELISIKNIKVFYERGSSLFHKSSNVFKAVDNVSFEIPNGKTVGLVGESGCGKSTIAKAICRLIPLTSGNIFYENIDISNMSEKELFPYRRNIQMIFQDPYGALNPRLNIFKIIKEPMDVHLNSLSAIEKKEKISYLLNKVGLDSDMMYRFPHQFSGGQRQRIGIARSLAADPKFIICDEPVSALDVSIQAQILNLLKDLQKEFKLTYLFIAHDLAVVSYLSDYILVMKNGEIVEKGHTKDVLENPISLYTKELIYSAKNF